MANKKRTTVYRPKNRRKASFSSPKDVMPAIVTIAAAGLLCIGGYMIAKPIVNGGDIPAGGDQVSYDLSAENAQDENAVTTAVSTNVVMVNGGTTTTVTTTALTTEEPTGTLDTSDGSGIDLVPSGDNNSSTDPDSSSDGSSGSGESSGDSSESGNSSGGSSSGSSGGSQQQTSQVYKTVQCSVRLPESAVSDEAALRAMLQNVKSQYPDAGAVVIPMKLQGGALNFASTASGNAGYLVNKGSMTAEKIASIVKDEGFYAYASCSMVVDHLYPQVYHSASYQIEMNGVATGDIYLDYFPDQGGKPWMDPGSSATVSYLSAIVDELYDGGFSAVLCSDFTFPSFWDSDEKYLDPDTFAKVPAPMIELANSLVENAPSGIDIVLDLSAYNTMNGLEPVYDTDELKTDYVLLSTSSANASTASSWAASNSGDMSVSLSYTDGTGSGHRVITY